MNQHRFVFIKQDIKRAAIQFLELTNGIRHFAFYGSMGVGKTTFITAICRQLGTNDLVSSPTFSIINEYVTKDGIPIFHFDFYRIKTQTELLDIGFDEYCQENVYCFIEWPEKGEGIIPQDFLKVSIGEIDNEKRVLSFSI
jgi:tRNA threonylcarbamoyladenosine biosynthesis protein TsaE